MKGGRDFNHFILFYHMEEIVSQMVQLWYHCNWLIISVWRHLSDMIWYSTGTQKNFISSMRRERNLICIVTLLRHWTFPNTSLWITKFTWYTAFSTCALTHTHKNGIHINIPLMKDHLWLSWQIQYIQNPAFAILFIHYLNIYLYIYI